MDKFKEAQAEWYGVLQTDKAADLKVKILQHATKPSVTSLVDNDAALQCVGKYPLEDFYAQGHKAMPSGAENTTGW